MISNQAVEQAAYDIMAKAAIDIPEDYLGGVKTMIDTEKVQLSCFVLQSMVENWEAATEDRRPMCADTGLPRYYVKVGNDARIDGGFVGIERALRSATARATHDIPLRPNRVHPLWRTDHNNNVGINSPEIEWSFEPDTDWLDISFRCTRAACSGPITGCCFPEMALKASGAFFSIRWLLSANADWPASRRSSASDWAARRTPPWCSVNRLHA